jgi:uncharacterized membrane protein
MPAWRDKLSEEHVRRLVAYIRALTATIDKQVPEPLPQQALADSFPTSFCEKLLHWLGSFHSPAVHFPIALLAAAAVAEVLRLVTGKAAFEPISRYCVWFGALTAIAAGVLGWCAASSRLADASSVLVLHAWLGTCTVALAGLVLGLSEGSRRLERPRMRTWFRATLVVATVFIFATGFFGGAVILGLDYHAWPP